MQLNQIWGLLIKKSRPFNAKICFETKQGIIWKNDNLLFTTVLTSW